MAKLCRQIRAHERGSGSRDTQALKYLVQFDGLGSIGHASGGMPGFPGVAGTQQHIAGMRVKEYRFILAGENDSYDALPGGKCEVGVLFAVTCG